jgi:hypothetical protein
VCNNFLCEFYKRFNKTKYDKTRVSPEFPCGKATVLWDMTDTKYNTTFSFKAIVLWDMTDTKYNTTFAFKATVLWDMTDTKYNMTFAFKASHSWRHSSLDFT